MTSYINLHILVCVVKQQREQGPVQFTEQAVRDDTAFIS